ncbi:MAG: PilZ domain-containing protein [Candidatus Omnitrophota bacterium]
MGLFRPPSSESKEERRRYLRIKHFIRVNYQIGNDTLRSDCRTTDISEGGIRLNLYQKLTAGTTLKLYIYFQGAMEPILILGKVVSIRYTPDKDYPLDAGIEFDFLDSSSRPRIKNLIRSIINEKNKEN